MITLGIDPGRTGAAAIVEGDAVLWRCRWRPRQRDRRRVYELTVHGEQPVLVPTLAHIGTRIADAASEYVLDRGACEGQAVARRSGVQSVLSLARMAGLVSSPVLADHPEGWTWPTCREWRPAVGIRANARAADAKRWAVDLVRQRAGIEVTEDEAEAICIAWSVLA